MWFLSCLLSLLVQGTEERALSFAIAGTVKEVLIKPGDTVKAGQELVRLKDGIALRIVKERQLMYKNRQVSRPTSEFATWMSLLLADLEQFWKLPTPEQLSVCYVDYLQLIHTTVVLRQRLEGEQIDRALLLKAQEELKRHTLASDADGVVVKVHIKPGENVTPGETVITIRVAPRK
jgi:multidrug resistance efflux pump